MTTSVASLVIRMEGDAQSYFKTVGDVEGSLKRMGSSITNVGKKLTLFGTVPLVGFGAMAFKTAADFEQAMANVGAIANADAATLQTLTSAAEELGRTTAFSASEAAEGMSYLAMAGFTATDIVSAMPGMLNLAAAGATDLATTADIASNVLTGFGLAASESNRVADVMTKTFTSSNTNLTQLGDAMSYLAPVAAAMGIDIETASAAVGMLSDAGIQGARAGTAVRGMLALLSSPTKQAQEWMDRLGVSVFNTSGELLDLPDIIDQFKDSFQGLTEEEQANAVDAIVGVRQAPAFLALLQQGGDAMREFRDELYASAGTSESVAQKQLDTFQGQMKLFKSAMEGLMITIGNAMLPVATAIVQGLTPVLTALANKWDSISPRMQKIIMVAGLFVAALGPVLVVVGQVVTALSALAPIAGAVGAVLGALAAPVALVAAALAGLYALNIGGFKEFVDNFIAHLGDLAEAAGWFWDAIEWIFQGKGDNVDWMYDITHAIERALGLPKDAMEELGTSFYYAGVKISNVVNRLKSAFTALSGYFGAIFEDGDYLNDWLTHFPESLQAALIEVGQFVGAISGRLKDLVGGKIGVSGFFDTLFEDGNMMDFGVIKQSILDTMGLGDSTLATDGIVAAIQEWWSTIPWAAIWQNTEESFQKITDRVQAWWDSVPWGDIWQTVREAYDAILDKVLSWWNAVPWGDIWQTVRSASDRLRSFVKAWWDAIPWSDIWQTTKEAFSAVTSVVLSWWNAIPWGDIWQTTKEAFSPITGAVATWWDNIPWGDIWQTTKEAFSGITTAVSTWWTSIPWGDIWQTTKDAFSPITTAVSTWWTGIPWGDIWQTTKEAFAGVTGAVATWWAGVPWADIWQTTKEAFSTVTTAVSTWWAGIPWADAWGVTVEAYTGITTAISTWWAGIPWADAWTATVDAYGTLTTAVSTWWDGISWADVWATTETKYEALLQAVRDWWNATPWGDAIGGKTGEDGTEGNPLMQSIKTWWDGLSWGSVFATGENEDGSETGIVGAVRDWWNGIDWAAAFISFYAGSVNAMATAIETIDWSVMSTSWRVQLEGLLLGAMSLVGVMLNAPEKITSFVTSISASIGSILQEIFTSQEIKDSFVHLKDAIIGAAGELMEGFSSGLISWGQLFYDAINAAVSAQLSIPSFGEWLDYIHWPGMNELTPDWSTLIKWPNISLSDIVDAIIAAMSGGGGGGGEGDGGDGNGDGPPGSAAAAAATGNNSGRGGFGKKSNSTPPSGGGGRSGFGFATGTDYSRGGWRRMGEFGPEYAWLPRGAAVLPQRQTAALDKKGMGTTINFTINGDVDSQKRAEQMLRQFVEMMDRRGI